MAKRRRELSKIYRELRATRGFYNEYLTHKGVNNLRIRNPYEDTHEFRYEPPPIPKDAVTYTPAVKSMMKEVAEGLNGGRGGAVYQYGGDVSLKIHWKAMQQALGDVPEYVKRVTNDRKYEIYSEYNKLVKPYIPYRTGALRRSADITSYGIEWSATNPNTGFTYSLLQYTNTNFHHRLGHDHWDVYAWPRIQDRFYQKVSQIMLKKL